jgi:hypothetical protein
MIGIVLSGGMAAQATAHVETVASGNHDIQKKKRRRLALGIRHKVCWSAVDPYAETGRFQMMLYQTGNIRIIFQNAYALAQIVLPEFPSGFAMSVSDPASAM